MESYRNKRILVHSDFGIDTIFGDLQKGDIITVDVDKCKILTVNGKDACDEGGWGFPTTSETWEILQDTYEIY